MSPGIFRSSIAVLCAWTFVPAPAAPEAGPRTGWHVVRPGDSIIEITEHYLGTSRRWKENWRLNPQIEDPHRISPGQRLKVLLGEDLPRRSARVAALSRRVEENPAPLDWSKANLDDLLRQRDGVRTQAASSAELELHGGNRMVITENSLVYLKGDRERSDPVRRQAIEIVEGQADLEAAPAPREPSDVEILIGGAVAKPRSVAGNPAQARARKPGAGGAQLMMYRGESALTAAGRKVEVAQGMGTTVPRGGAPAPPEKLLPAPAPRSPAAGARLAASGTALEWEGVPGAAEYTVEVCSDRRCGELVQRAVGRAETRWRAQDLPVGRLFWRVTATSPSGLDGYPSPPRSLEILAATADTLPPTVHLAPVGTHLAGSETLFLGAGAGLDLKTEDAGTGVLRQELRIDGRKVEAAALAGPWEPGRHELTLDVVDGAGNRSRLPPTAFVYDPEPPTISWEAVSPEWRSHRGMATKAWPRGGPPRPSAEARKKARKRARKGARKEAGTALLQWSGSGRAWQDLDRTWTARGPVDLLLLRAASPLFLEGAGRHLEVGERWKLDFDDATGIGGLRFSLETAEGGGKTLVLEIRDRLDNVRTERWPIQRPL